MEELVYSEEARKNRYLFYKEINDINIFVEDKDKEYEYETVLKQVFKDEYEISTIYALGGKNNVKEAFTEFGPLSDEGKKNIYIVDGDFDRFLNDVDVISHSNFIYLESYNIENYYIDEMAVVSFMKGKVHMLDEEVKKMVKFEDWLNETVEQFAPVFILYTIIQNKKLGISNVGENVHLKINKNDGSVRADIYQELYEKLSMLFENLSDLESEAVSNYNKIYDSYFNLICGKHLMCSLFYYLKSIKSTVKLQDLKWHLITNININKFSYLRTKVLSIDET